MRNRVRLSSLGNLLALRRLGAGALPLVFVVALVLAGCGASSNTTSSTTAAGASGTAPTSAAASAANADASNSAANGAAATAPAPIVVPAGTSIKVTLDQTVGTKNNAPGDRFAASVAVPVRVSGAEVIAHGARAVGHISASEEAGRVKGGARLVLALDSVTVNGQKYRVRVTPVSRETKGRGKRTAIGTGGGAAVGALIGALAGGGKGAAMGAGAGGGAGFAGSTLTGDRDITLSAETELTFRLEDPLQIDGQ